MSKVDINYHSLLETILEKGYLYDDPNREGVKRLEIPSYTFRHEFEDGFPAISTKKLHYKNVVTELLWFLRGDTNIKYLVDNGCNIWNKDAYNYYLKLYKQYNKFGGSNPYSLEFFISEIKNNLKKKLRFKVAPNFTYFLGDLGKVYGRYWRNYDGFDQIKDIIDKMINTPMSSEIIVTARNPNDKDTQALPCCHYGFQIVMRPLDIPKYHDIYNIPYPKYGFELHWNQRSVDTFLGLPYNITSYATLALILEKITGYKALGIQGDLKKVHLYDNSLDAVKEQMSRDVSKYKFCQLEQSYFTELMDEFDDKDFNLDDFIKMLDEDKEFIQLVNYKSYPAINVEMLGRNK
jgi:thymidylate synthase